MLTFYAFYVHLKHHLEKKNVIFVVVFEMVSAKQQQQENLCVAKLLYKRNVQ